MRFPAMDLILWVVRLLAFIGYATLSIILVTSLMSDGNCSVRHTYRQEFLAGFTANPFYSSTQIIRAPPSAYHMDTHGLVYAQHASDIGAFPVIIANPVKDAAFWPVVYDPDASLNSLYSAIPAGGIQSMLDAIDSIQNKEEYNVQLEEDLKHLPALSAIAKDASDVSKHKEWSPEMRKFGSYHLMKNGFVVATDMPMPTKTTGIFTSMYSQTQHGFAGHRGGMLPNIGRCVGEIQELPERKDEIEWLQRLAGLATNSHRRGSCLLTGQQDAVDVSSNHKTTAVWFTSLNMVYTTLIAVWISASFSLFLLGKPPVGEKHKKWMSRWESVVVAVAALWNVVLVVISVVSHYGHNIPMNNVFIGIILLSLAIGTQVVYSQSIFVDRSSEYLFKDNNIDDSARVADSDAGADEASHVLPTPKDNGRHNPEESNPRATSKPATGSYMPVSTSTFLEQSNRMKWRGARCERQPIVRPPRSLKPSY